MLNLMNQQLQEQHPELVEMLGIFHQTHEIYRQALIAMGELQEEIPDSSSSADLVIASTEQPVSSMEWSPS